MNNHRRNRALAEINIVPYVDVMLVLLIIFMITTPILTQGVDINLPQANTKKVSVEDGLPIIATVDKHGDYYLQIGADAEQRIEKKQLLLRLAAEIRLAQQAHQAKQVLVKGDKAISYDHVIELMALIQKAGVGQVGLLTAPPTEVN
jgi:biopolymer transport protein TolR